MKYHDDKPLACILEVRISIERIGGWGNVLLREHKNVTLRE